MSESPEKSWTNHERKFCIYSNRFYKRSLRSSEYIHNCRNKPHILPLGYERLGNETACLRFIQKETNIPVPDVLKVYDDNGSFVLVTQCFFGVQMDELSPENQTVVMKELEEHMKRLQTLHSTHIGGPSGIICLSLRFSQPKDQQNLIRVTARMDLMFCHCDPSQSNIIIDPKRLRINGVIGWEYESYWPSFFKLPFFRDP